MVLAPSEPGINRPLFHPPFRLLPFQATYAANCYYDDGILASDTGLGKGVTSLAAASLAIEDGLVDLVLIACESAKAGEWLIEIEDVTDLRPVLYVGTPKKRAEIRKAIADGTYNAVIGVYETFRIDMTAWEEAPKLKRGKRLIPGVLTRELRHRKVFWLGDEAPAKLGADRGSTLYKSTALFFNETRKYGFLRAIVASATPMNRDPVGFFNVFRLLQPEIAGNVNDFEEHHVASYDKYFKPAQFKNLDPEHCEPGQVSLKEKTARYIWVKSKADPDVRELFPKTVQDYTYVDFSDQEKAFYKKLLSQYSDEENEGAVYTALRQFCGHPLSLLTSNGGVAIDIVDRFGEDFLRSLPASKAEALMERVATITLGQEEQAVVFTFFGQTILPVLADMFRARGITVSVNHGKLSAAKKAEAQAEFRSGKTMVFLSSDAGARGINLPEASYVEEYDWAFTHSVHRQRVNRISRLSSKNPTIFAHAWAVRNSLEEGIIAKMVTRKGWEETLIDGKQEITTTDLRELLREARRSL